MARGSLARVAKTGRPSAYTPEQDAIILANKAYADVMDEFAKAGYDTNAHPSAISSRRKYLKDQGRAPAGASEMETVLVGLVAERRALEARRLRLEQELAEVNQRLPLLNEAIHASADAVKAEADKASAQVEAASRALDEVKARMAAGQASQ